MDGGEETVQNLGDPLTNASLERVGAKSVPVSQESSSEAISYAAKVSWSVGQMGVVVGGSQGILDLLAYPAPRGQGHFLSSPTPIQGQVTTSYKTISRIFTTFTCLCLWRESRLPAASFLAVMIHFQSRFLLYRRTVFLRLSGCLIRSYLGDGGTLPGKEEQEGAGKKGTLNKGTHLGTYS